MGSIVERSRKDGSKAFVAQIVIKKAGLIAHREAQSFDRKQAANAWIVKREAELKKPGGLEQKEDPPLSAVIDRLIAESKNAVLGTKAQVLKTIKTSSLGEIKCSEMTSHALVSFARAELFQQFTAEEFVRAAVWLETEVTHGRLVRARGSYNLKHEAEDATGGYISNGVLIAAAISLGLKVVPVPGTPNAMIGIPVQG
jgi:hypothetical protein